MSRRYRRNPVNIKSALSRPMAVIQPAAIGAAGALAMNGIINYVPGIPDNLKVGNNLYLTKAVIALLIGTFGPRLPGIGKYAGKMAEGALTVLLTDVGRNLAMQQGYNLSGTGFVSPARVVSLPRNGGNGNGNLKEYVTPRARMAGAGQYVSGIRRR